MTVSVIRPRFYRIAALLAFIVAQIVVLAIPIKLQESGDWGFQYAARNFAEGRLTLTDEQYIEQAQEVWNESGQLLSYAKIGDNTWALTWAPGYAFYLAPFERIGFPQLGASILSLALAAVLYLLLAHLRDEKTAFLGVVLLIFTPLYLAMWQRVYMDAFAALAFCGAGGGLYLYYWLSRACLGVLLSRMILLAAGLLLMASVGVRYTNIAVAAVFAVHFLVMAGRLHLCREHFWSTGLFFVLGMALSGIGLLIYNGVVFGTPFSAGSEFAQLTIRFAWQYPLGIGYDIVRNNIVRLWVPLLIALPIILAAIPALVAATYGKFFYRQSDTWPELPEHVYHVLWGWIVAVFGLYVMYDWTSFQESATFFFPLLTRFYLPMLLPLVIISALALRRFSAKLWGSTVVVLAVLGVICFIQVSRVQVYFADGAAPPSLSVPVPPATNPAVLSGDNA